MAKKLGERLIEAGLVTKEAVEQALQQQKITGHKLGDCLVELGLVSESVMLRFLATELNTRFVSADKLAKVRIPPEVMDRVPVRMAEAQKFIPIAIDAERKILSIVAAEPQNKNNLDEIALVTGMEEVYAFVGLRSAIEAGIKKHYYGDPTAFSSLESSTSPSIRSDISALAAAIERGTGSGRSPAPVRFETDPRRRMTGVGAPSTSMGVPSQRETTAITRGSITDSDFAETLTIMVGLLEAQRPATRGHSTQLSRQAALVARHLSMAPREVAQLMMAASLHHLGKPTDRHFTLASNQASPDWAADAKRFLKAPMRVFETVRLPTAVQTILGQLYEAWDGSGPLGLKGEDIALGARILSTLDAYLDLMKNPANGLGRALGRDEVIAHLSANAERLYDPVIVDVVKQLHSGELLRERLQADGRQIVVAEPDEGVRTDLLDLLRKAGIAAQTVRTMDAAADVALSGEADVVVVGLRLGLNDILALTDALRRQPKTAAVPVVVVGEPPDAMSRAQLQQVGVQATLPLPLEPETAAATIQKLFEERVMNGAPGRLVRGSYDELPAAEVLQLLSRGSKSGRLTVKGEGQEGYLQIEQGRVVHATLGSVTGEAGLKSLLKLRSADFAFDPESLLSELPTLDMPLALVANG